jgi:hypothetical protein
MSIFKPKAKQIVEVNWQLPNADYVNIETIQEIYDKKPEWILYAIRQKVSALKDLEHHYKDCIFRAQRPSKAGHVLTTNNMKVTTKIVNGKRVVNFTDLCNYFPKAYEKCVKTGKSYRKIYLSPLNGYDDFIKPLEDKLKDA